MGSVKDDAVDPCFIEGASTTSPSDGDDVRWFFSKAPLRKFEAAGSIPESEVVARGEFLRFSMRDSLALEAAFKQREEELLRTWWEEYAECNEGPSPACLTSAAAEEELPSSADNWLDPNKAGSDETMGVPVKGGLYEVNLWKRRSFPVYWSGQDRRVLRGLWFALYGTHWLPLREDVTEQLEVAYRKKVWRRKLYEPSGLYAARMPLSGKSSVKKSTLYALFTGEDSTWEAWLADDSNWNSWLAGATPGIPLRRGFLDPPDNAPYTKEDRIQQMEEELDDYCSQVPVAHVVFMVHGIGQRLDSARFVDQVTEFRRIVASLSEKFLTRYQRMQHRCLFIPCQWRRGLKLGGEAAVEDITLEGVRSLRTSVSATVHDVLYYMSPAYCQDIIDSVTTNLNFLFRRFKKRNPHFTGKVSVFGHSLGSVLLHDILCHQKPSQSLSASISEGTAAAVVEGIHSEAGNVLTEAAEAESIVNSRSPMRDNSGAEQPSALCEAETSAEEGGDDDVSALQCQIAALQERLGYLLTKKKEGPSQKDHNECTHDEPNAGKAVLKISEEGQTAERGGEIMAGGEANVRDTTCASTSEGELASPSNSQLGANDTEVEVDDDSLSNRHNASMDTVVDIDDEDSSNRQLHASDTEVEVDEESSSNKQHAANHTEVQIDEEAPSNVEHPANLTEVENDEEARGNDGRDADDVGEEELFRADLDTEIPEGETMSGQIPEEGIASFPGQSVEDHNCNQSVSESESMASTSGSSRKPRRQHAPRIEYAILDFEVDSFFAVGSPLGLFLALRNIRLGTGDGPEQLEGIQEELPACRSLLNIFHPYDPVAYRIEPLVSREYVKLKPVFAPHYRGHRRVHIQFQEWQDEIVNRIRRFFKKGKKFLFGMKTQCFGLFTCEKGIEKPTAAEEEDARTKLQLEEYAKRLMARLTGSADGRIDYMLQEATFDYQYIVAFKCHLTYWSDKDTALLIIQHLYRDTPREPFGDFEEEAGGSSERREEGRRRGRPRTAFDLDDDDGVALTFQSGGKAAAALADALRISRAADPLNVQRWGLAA